MCSRMFYGSSRALKDQALFLEGVQSLLLP